MVIFISISGPRKKTTNRERHKFRIINDLNLCLLGKEKGSSINTAGRVVRMGEHRGSGLPNLTP